MSDANVSPPFAAPAVERPAIASAMAGLHFFAMSDGEYSDYGVSGFYVCDHAVTEEEWHTFCKDERPIREAKKAEICTAPHPGYEKSEALDTWYGQFQEYQKWVAARGSYEAMFAAKHSMVPIEYDELHLDFD